MKKLLLSFVMLLGVKQSLTAQNYIPLLDSAINEWRFTLNVIPIRRAQLTSLPNCTYSFSNEQELSTMGDTLLSGNIYKTLIASYQNIPTCVFGYLREDTASRKVYFKDVNNAPEITLYDFSMLPGDSIYVNFYNNSGYFENGNYTLDSIKNISISSGTTRAFYLHHKINFNPNDPRTLIWYEGVGNPFYTIYPYSANFGSFGWFSGCQEFKHDFITFLTCFDHAVKMYYDTCGYWEAHHSGCVQFDDSCTYYNICSDVRELNPKLSVEVSPNPVRDKLFLRTSKLSADAIQIAFYSLTGNRISKAFPISYTTVQLNVMTLDVSDLESGFYLIELSSEGVKQYQKIMVMH